MGGVGNVCEMLCSCWWLDRFVPGQNSRVEPVGVSREGNRGDRPVLQDGVSSGGVNGGNAMALLVLDTD